MELPQLDAEAEAEAEEMEVEEADSEYECELMIEALRRELDIVRVRR